MLHENVFQIINMYISAVKTGLQSYCDTSYSKGGWCESDVDLRTLKSTYNLGPFPPAIALKHLTSLPSTQLFFTLS